jgi:hypothetical protein
MFRQAIINHYEDHESWSSRAATKDEIGMDIQDIQDLPYKILSKKQEMRR